MTSLHVDESDVHSEELDVNETFGKLADGVYHQHQIMSLTTTSPRFAVAAAMGQPMSKGNNIQYIDIESVIYKYYQKLIEKHGNRCVIIVDLTNFPVILTRLDIRDQVEVCGDDDDQFSKDMKHHFTTYDMEKEIPVVMVNMNITSTGLLIHKFGK